VRDGGRGALALSFAAEAIAASRHRGTTRRRELSEETGRPGHRPRDTRRASSGARARRATLAARPKRRQSPHGQLGDHHPIAPATSPGAYQRAWARMKKPRRLVTLASSKTRIRPD